MIINTNIYYLSHETHNIPSPSPLLLQFRSVRIVKAPAPILFVTHLVPGPFVLQ